jgi:hypothetical protein
VLSVKVPASGAPVSMRSAQIPILSAHTSLVWTLFLGRSRNTSPGIQEMSESTSLDCGGLHTPRPGRPSPSGRHCARDLSYWWSCIFGSCVIAR